MRRRVSLLRFFATCGLCCAAGCAVVVVASRLCCCVGDCVLLAGVFIGPFFFFLKRSPRVQKKETQLFKEHIWFGFYGAKSLCHCVSKVL